MYALKKLTIADTRADVVHAMSEAFRDRPDVEIQHCEVQKLSADCLITAGNSFGIMDGGVDLAIREMFGITARIQTAVQGLILSRFGGEQPVGSSVLVRTNTTRYTYLAHTPTMRLPNPIVGTTNVYYALKAALLAIEQHNLYECVRTEGTGIHSVVCPGLGTGIGGLAPEIAAKQMALAHLHMSWAPKPITAAWARERVRLIEETRQ